MIERLGRVLYWVACGVAVLSLLLAAWSTFAAFYFGEGGFVAVGAAVFALAIWLVGRAILYVLAAK